MKLKRTTSLNDAIKRIADGDHRAASVIALLIREHPRAIMEFLHELDRRNMYGSDLVKLYWNTCDGQLADFVMELGVNAD